MSPERYDLCDVAICAPHRSLRGWRGLGGDRRLGPHRQDALSACRDVIGELKERVPLWKKELYGQGEEWIGRGS